jgi:putative protein-disulfide isomerase
VSAPVLHYIYDPLCGWCYGAAPLVQALRTLPGLTLELHAGGMFAGTSRQPVTPQLRSYVLQHDRRIAGLTGQVFGSGYADDLLHDAHAVLDSEPPITAILAAQSLAGSPERAPWQALDMLGRIQRAHYVDGRRVADRAVLVQIAAEGGIDAGAFRSAYERFAGKPTWEHIAQTRQWLERAGGQGFPTVAFAAPDGAIERLDPGRNIGQPAAFVEAVRLVLARQVQAGAA